MSNVVAVKKTAEESALKLDVDASNAHKILGHLAKCLSGQSFGVNYCADSNPVMRAGFFIDCKFIESDFLEDPLSTCIFQNLRLADIRKNGKLVVGRETLLYGVLVDHM